MNMLFYLGGLFLGLFSITNLIIALFLFIPLAKRHAHSYRPAPYISRFRRFLFGPVPYASILIYPLFATALLLALWVYVRSEWFQYSLLFASGVVTSVFFGMLSLPDKNGRHRRTFNLSWGDLYDSDFFGKESITSLKVEQQYHDLPDFIKDARFRLLAGGGRHQSSPQIKEDLSLLSERYGIQPDIFYKTFMKEQYPDLEEGELPEWKTSLIKEEAYIIPKALISFKIAQQKTGEIIYDFRQTLNFLT